MSRRVLLLRHGQSRANVQGLIASSPDVAGDDWGLTSEGRAQVRASVRRAGHEGRVPPGSPVVTSPLLRAVESAAIAAEVLDSEVRLDSRLMERGFGELDLGPDRAYRKVWAADREDPGHERWGVESLEAVERRGVALVREVATWDGTVLLCTHGDVVSVLMAAALGVPLTRHREVGALRTGRIADLPVAARR